MNDGQERVERFSVDWMCYCIATLGTLGFKIPRWIGQPEGKGAGMTASIMTFVLVQIPLLWAGEIAGYSAATVNLALTIITFFIGMEVIGPADTYMARRFGKMKRHDGTMSEEDFNGNCWDEVIGMLAAGILPFYSPDIICALFPAATNWPPHVMQLIVLAYLFACGAGFRVFDGLKWWGIKRVEKWFEQRSHESTSETRSLIWRTLGIIIDDLVAALYGCLIPTALFGIILFVS